MTGAACDFVTPGSLCFDSVVSAVDLSRRPAFLRLVDVGLDMVLVVGDGDDESHVQVDRVPEYHSAARLLAHKDSQALSGYLSNSKSFSLFVLFIISKRLQVSICVFYLCYVYVYFNSSTPRQTSAGYTPSPTSYSHPDSQPDTSPRPHQ